MGKTRIPLDTFYILVAQKIGRNCKPETARKYGEAIQEVIYEQLALNNECYWYGFGNFTKTISKSSGRYIIGYDYKTKQYGRTYYVEPKYILNFNPLKRVMDALNQEQEKYPKFIKKRKYSPRNYRKVRNERRRKEIPSVESLACRLINEASVEFNSDGDNENEE